MRSHDQTCIREIYGDLGLPQQLIIRRSTFCSVGRPRTSNLGPAGLCIRRERNQWVWEEKFNNSLSLRLPSRSARTWMTPLVILFKNRPRLLNWNPGTHVTEPVEN